MKLALHSFISRILTEHPLCVVCLAGKSPEDTRSPGEDAGELAVASSVLGEGVQGML